MKFINCIVLLIIVSTFTLAGCSSKKVDKVSMINSILANDANFVGFKLVEQKRDRDYERQFLVKENPNDIKSYLEIDFNKDGRIEYVALAEKSGNFDFLIVEANGSQHRVRSLLSSTEGNEKEQFEYAVQNIYPKESLDWDLLELDDPCDCFSELVDGIKINVPGLNNNLIIISYFGGKYQFCYATC